MKLETGLIQVYTGNGKGKTTAAPGPALRATGHGLRVHMIQFMKGAALMASKRMASLLIISPTGLPGWVKKGKPDPEDRREAQRALALARESLRGEL